MFFKVIQVSILNVNMEAETLQILDIVKAISLSGIEVAFVDDVEAIFVLCVVLYSVWSVR